MKLFVYEHCPFCVIAQMIFALKHHPVELECLLYDDVQTPMRMTGRKILPILEYEPNSYMSESLNIIRYIDETFDSPKIVLTTNESLAYWVNTVERFIYRLTYPRWIRAPFPEFSTEEAKKYFLHSKDPSGRGFISDLSDIALIKRGQKALNALEILLEEYPLLDPERDLSIEDFTLYAHLHSLSIVQGLIYGPKVEKWRKCTAEICSIPLHDEFAN